jgi:TPR repeat protein
MMRTLVPLLVVLLTSWGAGSAGAQSAAGERVAIVIGNGSYAIGPLTNPPRDAALVASALAALDFEVYEARDLTTEGFETFYTSIEGELAGADVLFVYYAGHAFSFRGDNRLLMTDATEGSQEAIIEHSLSLTDLVARFAELEPNTLVLALDSCRDNPFSGSNEIESGLAYLETGTGQVMIGYATSAGQVAYDGYGDNSPYAMALSNALLDTTPGERSLTDVFREVRRDVREATNGFQIPWVSSSVEEDVIIARADATEVIVSLPENDLPTLEEILWYFVHNSPHPEDLEAYVEAFPSGFFVADARSILSSGFGESRSVFVDGAQPIATAPAEPTEMVFATTGDRSPPAELRAWPSSLPAVPGGLASLSDECAVLASDPDDPSRVTPGVQVGLINIRSAVRACVLALQENPEDARTMFHLGRVLDAAHRYAWAADFYREAIAGGYSAAMVNLGFLYINGRGVEQDYRQAFELYQQAALLGNMRGRTNVGSMFRNGQGVERSYEEALLWYRLAGSNGWPNAIDALANMYARGQGVPESPEQAAQLYLAAATLGQTNAMNNLGRAYLNGAGVPQDDAEGLRWLEAGVAAGNRFAAQSLARYFMDSDPERAETLYVMSAERGNPEARVDLARFYDRRGDTSEAFYQIRLAQELDVERAAEFLPAIEAKLSADERGAVEERVRDWLELNGS